MGKKLTIARIFMVLAGVCITLATLLTSIDTAAMDKRFYRHQYEKLGTAETIGVSEEALMEATRVLLDYMSGKRDDLSLVVEKDGIRTQMFTDETEVKHMVDVQALYEWMLTVRNWLALLAVGFVIAAFGLRIPPADGMKKLLIGLFLGLAVPIVCGALAAADFNWFWTQFHHVFFTNDLWLLNPATSVLIQMVPEEFFSAIVLKILIWFAVVLVLWIGLTVLTMRICQKRKGKKDEAIVGH